MHIRSIHQIEVLKRKSENETKMELYNKPNQQILNTVRTFEYYINDSSLPAVLARMTASESLIQRFTTPFDLRTSISELGRLVPKSVR